MDKYTLYVISNANSVEYPDNTLTSFSNKFPLPLNVRKRYKIGVESIGF